MENKSIIVDTNILVYLVDEESKYHKSSSEKLKKLYDNNSYLNIY